MPAPQATFPKLSLHLFPQSARCSL